VKTENLATNFKCGIELPWNTISCQCCYCGNSDWEIEPACIGSYSPAKDRDFLSNRNILYVIYRINPFLFAKVNFISHSKLKVLELSTGKTKVEKWTFLPANWDYELERRPIFDKNFVFLDFEYLPGKSTPLSTDTGDILILNLVNRTKFWIRRGTLTTRVKEKAAGGIGFGAMVLSSYAIQMDVEKDRIVINYRVQCHGYTLG